MYSNEINNYSENVGEDGMQTLSRSFRPQPFYESLSPTTATATSASLQKQQQQQPRRKEHKQQQQQQLGRNRQSFRGNNNNTTRKGKVQYKPHPLERFHHQQQQQQQQQQQNEQQQYYYENSNEYYDNEPNYTTFHNNNNNYNNINIQEQQQQQQQPPQQQEYYNYYEEQQRKYQEEEEEEYLRHHENEQRREQEQQRVLREQLNPSIYWLAKTKPTAFHSSRNNRKQSRHNRQRWMEVAVNVNSDAYKAAYRYVEANFDIWLAQVALKGEIHLPGICTDYHRRALLNVAPQFGYTPDMRNTACNFAYVVETNKMYMRCFSHNKHVGPAIARELYRFEEQHRAIEMAKQQQQQQQEQQQQQSITESATTNKSEPHAPALLTWYFCDRLLYHQVVQLIRLLAYEMGVYRGNLAPSFEQQRTGGSERVEGHYEPCFIYKLEIGLEYQKAWEVERQALIAEDRKGLVSPFPLPRELWAKDAFMYRYQRFVKPFLYNWNPTVTRCTIDSRRGVDFPFNQLPDHVRTIALLCGLRVEFDHYNTVFFRLSTRHSLNHFAQFSRYFKLQDELAVEAALVELRHSRPDLKNLQLLEEAKKKTPHFGLFNFALETNFLAEDLHELQRFASTNGYYVYIRYCDKIVFIAAVSRDLPELPKEQFELFFLPNGCYMGPDTFADKVDSSLGQAAQFYDKNKHHNNNNNNNMGNNGIILPSLIHLLTEEERAELPAEMQNIAICKNATDEETHQELVKTNFVDNISNSNNNNNNNNTNDDDDSTKANLMENTSSSTLNKDIKIDVNADVSNTEKNEGSTTEKVVIHVAKRVREIASQPQECSNNNVDKNRDDGNNIDKDENNMNATSTEDISEVSYAYSDCETESNVTSNYTSSSSSNSNSSNSNARKYNRKQKRRVEKCNNVSDDDDDDDKNEKCEEVYSNVKSKFSPSVGEFSGPRRYFWPTSLTSTSLYKLVMSSRSNVDCNVNNICNYRNNIIVHSRNNFSNNDNELLAPGFTRETTWVQWRSVCNDHELFGNVDVTFSNNNNNNNNGINNTSVNENVDLVKTTNNTENESDNIENITTTLSKDEVVSVNSNAKADKRLTPQQITFMLDHLSRIAYPS